MSTGKSGLFRQALQHCVHQGGRTATSSLCKEHLSLSNLGRRQAGAQDPGLVGLEPADPPCGHVHRGLASSQEVLGKGGAWQHEAATSAARHAAWFVVIPQACTICNRCLVKPSGSASPVLWRAVPCKGQHEVAQHHALVLGVHVLQRPQEGGCPQLAPRLTAVQPRDLSGERSQGLVDGLLHLQGWMAGHLTQLAVNLALRTAGAQYYHGEVNGLLHLQVWMAGHLTQLAVNLALSAAGGQCCQGLVDGLLCLQG